MPVDCQLSTSGGKGNKGMFIERDRNICAAGLPSAQPHDSIADSLQHYLLKDEVDALLSDSIMPTPKPRPLPPLRHPMPLDTRHAGTFGDVAQLVNPPILTKFQTLVEDFKNTVYTSYWKKALGQVQDPVPMLPAGFDLENTTFGKKTENHGRLYDLVMPKIPLPDKTPLSKQAGAQRHRNYCTPPFDPNLTYGYRAMIDPRGFKVKCCLTDDNVILGNGKRMVINSIQADYQESTLHRLGTVLEPNNNISCVPNGYAFGELKPPENLHECLTTCEINPGLEEFRNCLKHLNSLRKCLRKKVLPTFFGSFYLNLKYFDNNNTGWLPKDVVYKYCGTKYIRFDPALLEPLLSMWRAFDGANIEYKTFVLILNYKQPLPYMPKVPDVPDDCIDFRTTYSEMVKPEKEIDSRRMAGVPSGRYFDMDYPVTPNNCCLAHRSYLPQEIDMKSCLNPSVPTLLHVNHRDMYQKREPEVVRRVFEASEEKFTDERFNAVWEDAKTYHSQGWVCFETFREALETGPKSFEKKVVKKIHGH